jgi:hypothetical protein
MSDDKQERTLTRFCIATVDVKRRLSTNRARAVSRLKVGRDYTSRLAQSNFIEGLARPLVGGPVVLGAGPLKHQDR